MHRSLGHANIKNRPGCQVFDIFSFREIPEIPLKKLVLFDFLINVLIKGLIVNLSKIIPTLEHFEGTNKLQPGNKRYHCTQRENSHRPRKFFRA